MQLRFGSNVGGNEPTGVANLSDQAVRSLFRPIEDFKLSVRARNCLHREEMRLVGDIATCTPNELLKIENLGAKTLNELSWVCTGLGLRLGLRIPHWPPFDQGGINANQLGQMSVSDLRSLLVATPHDVRRIIKDIVDGAETFETSSIMDLPKEVKIALVRKVDELNFSYRVINVFHKAHIKYIGDLIQWNETELMKLNNFGRKSLSQVKRYFESGSLHLGTSFPGWNHEVSAECELEFAAELWRLRQREARGRMMIDGRPPLTLEEELHRLAVVNTERDREVGFSIKVFGLNGKGTRTLESVGREYGVTRERVRQITAKFADRVGTRTQSVPLLERALKRVTHSCPARADRIEKELVESELSNSPFNITGLIATAGLIDILLEFEIVKFRKVKFAVPTGWHDIPSKVNSQARKMTSRFGCGTVEDLAEEVPLGDERPMPNAFVTEVLATQNGFRWLDQETGWFWFADNPRNRLLNQIAKVLAVVRCVRVGELRTAVSRHHRMSGFAPPRRVLVELCRQLPACRIENESVVADSPPRPENVLSEIELIFWQIFSEHGPIMKRQELEEYCMGFGMNRSSFYVYLRYSPIISRLGIGVYCLVGASVQPGAVEDFARTSIARRRVLIDHGWTRDNHIWLGYRLSHSVITTGVCGIPSSIKDFVQGSFELQSVDGSAFGTVTAKDQSLWGLAKFFRRRGGEPNDLMIVTCDLGNRQMVVRIGDTGLLESYQRGDDALGGDVLEILNVEVDPDNF